MKSKKKIIDRSGKSRFTKTISFRASNELHDATKKKVGKKNIGKTCLMLLQNFIKNGK